MSTWQSISFRRDAAFFCAITSGLGCIQRWTRFVELLSSPLVLTIRAMEFCQADALWYRSQRPILALLRLRQMCHSLQESIVA